ncbi:HNH endonuclease [Gordonia sputi]
MQADVRLSWVAWFARQFIDSTRFSIDRSLTWSVAYAQCSQRLVDYFEDCPRDEIRIAARKITDIIWAEVEVERSERNRVAVSNALKEDLWLANEPGSRCYLCGREFDELAREKYLGRRTGIRDRALPTFVDFTRPIGLVPRDLDVEIDHYLPVSAGGRTELANLRLSCGWCNRIKGARSTLYQGTAYSGKVLYVKELGYCQVPDPLWVVRVIATRGRCEYRGGCSVTLASGELFVAPRRQNTRELTPFTMGVYCKEHDQWKTARYVPRTALSGRHDSDSRSGQR